MMQVDKDNPLASEEQAAIDAQAEDAANLAEAEQANPPEEIAAADAGEVPAEPAPDAEEVPAEAEPVLDAPAEGEEQGASDAAFVAAQKDADESTAESDATWKQAEAELATQEEQGWSQIGQAQGDIDALIAELERETQAASAGADSDDSQFVYEERAHTEDLGQRLDELQAAFENEIITEGAGETRLQVTAIANNYLTCRTWDGTTQGTVDILVAKPPMLRHVLANYPQLSSLTTVNAQQVTAIAGAVSETWKVTPLYTVGTEIHAFVTATGVVVATIELTLMDANHSARAWAKI